MRLIVRTTCIVMFALSTAACDDASSNGAEPARSVIPTSAEGTMEPPPVRCGADDLAPVFCADTGGMEPATVVDIIDGDTLDVIVNGREERIRIFGIDTPERGDPCFNEASDLLESLAGDEIRMKTDVRTVDGNGRLLRYVYQPGGVSIDAVMIATGAAYAWTRDGALRDDLVALEAEARAGSVGCLWD